MQTYFYDTLISSCTRKRVSQISGSLSMISSRGLPLNKSFRAKQLKINNLVFKFMIKKAQSFIMKHSYQTRIWILPVFPVPTPSLLDSNAYSLLGASNTPHAHGIYSHQMSASHNYNIASLRGYTAFFIDHCTAT